tara:strand:+ start:510 stop:806 length:297 start_codon:yes stop_codon:yes gene_type:complete
VILSFTNKDAKDLRDSSVRMLRRLGYFDKENENEEKLSSEVETSSEAFSKRLWAGTFHAFSNSIIRKYGTHSQKKFRVISSAESRSILKTIVTTELSR